MKKVYNNMFKVCAFLLLAVGAAQPMNAAEPTTAKKPLTFPGGQKIEVGDTIRIHKDSLYYLTGERMSKWVYTKPHTIQQVGGRRYPCGVLLRGIYSWVYPHTISPVHPKAPKIDTISVVACDKYLWDATNTEYTESGEYTFKGKAANGCDSIVRLFLTIDPTASTTISRTVCGEFYWEETGETYTTSGDYTFTTTAANGCDSVVTLRLTIRKPTQRKTTVEIRPRHLPYEWHGIEMNNIGDTSRISGKDMYGCDIIENLHLKFKEQRRWGKRVIPVIPGWTVNIPYHIDRLSIGVRAGFASNFAGPKLPIGSDALFDVGLAHYWVAGEEKTAFGLKTGVSLGYVYTTQHMNPDPLSYSTTVGNDVLNYNIAVNEVRQNTHQLQLEVPVMFAMQTPGGFFLNAGPKFILPVYSNYQQILKDPVITVTGFEELDGRPLVNNPVTGLVSKEQANFSGKYLVENPCKLFSLALGAELGYNIKLKKYGQSIDLGVYADYSVFNLYKANATPVGNVISIVPPTDYSAAIVNVQSLSSAYSNKFEFFDVGIKISFNFDASYYFN